MPCKTLYYILTLALVIICGKDRLCLWGEGVDVCVWREGGGVAGLGYCKKQSQDFTGDNHQLRKK